MRRGTRSWLGLAAPLVGMMLTGCGTPTKPNSDLLQPATVNAGAKPQKQMVCLVLPRPDFSDPRCVADHDCWQRHYDVIWNALRCNE